MAAEVEGQKPDGVAVVRAYSGLLVAPLVSYLHDFLPERAFDALITEVGLDASEVSGPTSAGWLPADRVERLVARAGRALIDEEELERACGYRLAAAWRGFRFALWAPTVAGMLQRAADAEQHLSIGTRCTVEEIAAGRMKIRVETDTPESRDLRRLRVAVWRHLPTLWGLDPLNVVGEPLSADDDRSFSFQLAVREPSAWKAPAVGAGVGLATAWVLSGAFEPLLPLAVVLLVSGAAAGWAWPKRRREAMPELDDPRMILELRRLALSGLNEREELRALGTRADRWAMRVREESSRREGGPRPLDASRRALLRGFSHDFRNPLAVVRSGAELLRQEMSADHPLQPVVRRMREATEEVETSITRVLASLSELDPDGSGRRVGTVESIDCSHLSSSIRRRLRALATDRALRTSVFRSREAPDRIECDRLSLERALDLLLARAVDATADGSIVVEIGGRPAHLVVKVSDTGGEQPDLAALGDSASCAPSGSSEDSPLGALVDVVDRLAGRLEVLSNQNGTTFWLEVPVTPSDEGRTAATDSDPVVAVRRHRG